MSTMVVWFIAWLVSMVLVTIIYLKLMPFVKQSSSTDEEDDDTAPTKTSDETDQ